jgi:hypothetical protein
LTGSTGTFTGGGQTYYNVTKASNGFAIGDSNNTFNALTMNTVTTSGTYVCSFAGNQTIGTLTINGGSNATARASIQAPNTSAGTQVTLTVGTFVTNGYIDFRDINFAGAASPLTVATGGDCGNNTNITLATPKTVYWSLVAGGNWCTSTAWALTSGGAPALANYPLPQDTAIIEDTGLNSGATVTINAGNNTGTVNISSRTLPMTLGLATSTPSIYGNLTLSSAVTTTTTTGFFSFSGFNKTQTITSAGTTVAFQIVVNGRLTTVALAGALTMSSTATFTLSLGTLNLANNNLTCGLFNSNNSNTRAITFGTGQIYVIGTGIAIDFSTMTGFTYTGSGVFNYSGNFSTGGRTCIFGSASGGTESNALTINFTAGTDVCAPYGNGIRSLNFTGYAGNWVPTGGQTLYGDLTLSTTMTVTSTGNLTFAATSGIQNFTSNGKALVSLVFKTGAGTLRLVDAATLGTTFTHTGGSVDLNAQTASVGLYSSTGSTFRTMIYNGGTIIVSGASWTVSGTNYLFGDANGAICMTSSSTKTFAGGGFSYPTLSQDGPAPGPLVITGANTFYDITNGRISGPVQGTIIFPPSTTTTVSNFTAGGTSILNIINVESSTAGTAAIINYVGTGTVYANYLEAQDLTVTPVPRWQANAATTTLISNVTGWNSTNFYYWVGGTGNWDATATKWAATSGGAGGAGVPTLSDNVFFDSASNATAYVCTLTTTPVCASVNIAGPAVGNVTIAGSAAWSIYGSFTLAATGVTWANSSTTSFAATTTGWTVTTNGISLTGIYSFNGLGGGWTLGSAFTTSVSVQMFAGTLTTNNFNVTVGATFNLTGSLVRTLNLGSSAVSAGTWNALGATNFTMNAGTSTITTTGTFSGGSLTYYNLTKANNGLVINDANNTFNALTMNTVTANGTYLCTFAGNQTIGTLTINGGSTQVQRTSIQGVTPGVQITLTVATFVTNGYIDFRDINFQGAASPLTVATGGDCGNNTNITLQTPKTVYWSFAAGANWTATGWALTSGGAPAVANYPLAQDTVIIDDASLSSGATLNFNVSPNIGTINMSSRTLPMTFATSTLLPIIYGNLTLSSAVTITATTGVWSFSGYNKTQTITSAGVTVAFGVTVNGLSTTVALSGALTMTAQFVLTLGTLNLANNNLTTANFNSTNTNTRAITFGTGQIYVTGNSGFLINLDTMTGFTYTGSGTFNYTYSGATGTRYCTLGNTAGAVAANALNLNVTAGTDLIGVYGLGYKNVNFTGFAGTWVEFGTRYIYGDLTLSTGMTVSATTSTDFVATSGIQNITSNGKTITFPINKFGAGTLRLVDALTLGSTLTFTHTAGTVDLNNLSLTCGLFNTNNSNTRAITFGTGQINLTGNNGTIWTFNNGSGLTITGSATVNATYSGATGTRFFLGYGVGTAVINVNFTAGTDIARMDNAGFNNINFTGFTGSVITGIGGTGNITLGAGMTITSATSWSMFGTSGTQLFTSNGVTLDAPMTFNGTGGAYQLQDNLTLGSTRFLSLTNGTLNLNGKTLSTGTVSSSGVVARSIAFNGGTMAVSGATFSATGSNFTTSGAGVISMTSASSKTFAGGGFSYPTLNQGGAGALIITGANTFRTIANTVAPSTITLPASTTTSIAGFDLVGSAGNLVTLNSSASGTQATLNNTTGGRIGGDYLSYQDTNATPANTISAGANSTSVSNNTGWLTTPVVFGATSDSYTLSETEASQVSFAPINAESLTLANAQSTQVAFAPTNAETLTLADAQSSQVAINISTPEAITFTDSTQGIRGQFGSVADATTLTNTQAAQAGFRPTQAESVTLTDTRTATAIFVGNDAETIVFTDARIQRGWIKINNSQTPNWTPIDDSQG